MILLFIKKTKQKNCSLVFNPYTCLELPFNISETDGCQLQDSLPLNVPLISSKEELLAHSALQIKENLARIDYILMIQSLCKKTSIMFLCKVPGPAYGMQLYVLTRNFKVTISAL